MKKMALTGLVLTSMGFCLSCGNNKKSSQAKPLSPVVAQHNESKQPFGDWTYAGELVPLDVSYESPSGKTVHLKMTPIFRFEAHKFSSIVQCDVAVDGVKKTIEAMTESDITYHGKSFEVRSRTFNSRMEKINGDDIFCGEAELAAGLYTFEWMNDQLLLKSPDDANYLIKRHNNHS